MLERQRKQGLWSRQLKRRVYTGFGFRTIRYLHIDRCCSAFLTVTRDILERCTDLYTISFLLLIKTLVTLLLVSASFSKFARVHPLLSGRAKV